MVTKKIRTEYMKKFRDPRWETFSKCYEDSLRYRLTRRVLEHAHKPWIWEGWDAASGGSGSSGWTTPRLSRNRITPLTLPPPPPATAPAPAPPPQPRSEDCQGEAGGDQPEVEERPGVVENGVSDGVVVPVGPSEDTGTDGGPADTTSSDGERGHPAPKRRPRRRTPRSEPGRRDGSHDDQPAATTATVRKPPRAKSQPPIRSKNTPKTTGRGDWTDVRRTTHNTSSMAWVRGSDSEQRSSTCDRRRARSADVVKSRCLAAAGERWVTEYMRCFSARLR